MKQLSRISAVVLAAGMSTRMGRVKQQILFRSKTLLAHVLNTVRNSQVDEIVLVLGHAAAAIQQQISLDGLKVVTNPAYREGMSTSLQKGISAIDSQSEAAMIVLADQPFVRAETIDLLISQFCDREPQIAMPIHNGSRGNPVILHRSLFPEIMRLSGDTGCRAIFAKHSDSILKVPVDDPGILQDIDTETDLEQLDEFRNRAG